MFSSTRHENQISNNAWMPVSVTIGAVVATVETSRHFYLSWGLSELRAEGREIQLNTVISSSAQWGITEPSDIANVALFLASDASSRITGQTILVDGGQSLGLTWT